MTRYDWMVLAATIAFCVGVAVIASGPSGGAVGFLSHPSTASWVQAIGSIAAILAAIRIASSARRDQERDRTIGAYNAAKTATQYALVLLEAAQQETVARRWNDAKIDLSVRQFRDARAMLERLPIADLPGEIVAGRVINCFRVLHLVETAHLLIQTALNGGQPYPAETLNDPLEQYRAQLVAMEAGGQSWLQRRGW